MQKREGRKMKHHAPAGGHDNARISDLEREVAYLRFRIGELGPDRKVTPPSLKSEMIGFAASSGSERDFPELRVSGMSDRTSPEARARFVRELIRRRRARDHFFPGDYFADPVWDMMLDLYAAYYDGQPVSVSSLCIAAAVPATTALRSIKSMTDSGVFVRTRDASDGRRVYIDLSDETRLKLDVYFDTLGE